jgi:hypothetical protein
MWPDWRVPVLKARPAVSSGAQCAASGGGTASTPPQFFGKVMTVHCRCANDNRCAACGQPLYEHKLNANYYNPRDGQIWHVPAFCGLSHQCMVRPGL